MKRIRLETLLGQASVPSPMNENSTTPDELKILSEKKVNGKYTDWHTFDNNFKKLTTFCESKLS